MSTPPGAANDGNARIDCADYRAFLSSLEDRSVNLVLTDPPYAISRKTGFANVRNGIERFAVSMDFGEWDHEEIDLVALSNELYRVLGSSGTVIIWYDIWKLSVVRCALESAGFKMFRQVIWQKTNPVPLNSRSTYLSNSREMAVVCVKGGTPTFHGSYDNGIYEYPIPRHAGRRVHPTQKPLCLFTELVNKHSNEGDLVIDPFLGSGTTAIAAREGGRRFAGCDINQDYVEEARRRLWGPDG